MIKKLVLVDYENRQQIDLSQLDDSYRAIIFVGALQNPPKASKKKATAHRFTRVDFYKIEGTGKNALDFHIAFHLGRIFETAPETECYVLSGDKGFDPLLAHLNRNGLRCRRIESISELLPQAATNTAPSVNQGTCTRCKRASTVEHYGGRWCSYCGIYSVPPDPAQLPSRQFGYQEREPHTRPAVIRLVAKCEWCHQAVDMSDGIYDDGEWMCSGCIAMSAR